MASKVSHCTVQNEYPLVETGASDLIISKLEDYLVQVAINILNQLKPANFCSFFHSKILHEEGICLSMVFIKKRNVKIILIPLTALVVIIYKTIGHLITLINKI